MNLSELRQKKGIIGGKSSVLDFMGAEEFAANLFRITQTQAKIRNEKLRGQLPLERAAHDVGHTVRSTMIKISGKAPESLPAAEDIKAVKGEVETSATRVWKARQAEGLSIA